MSYYNSKSTKRFSFGINLNPTAKQAGSNLVTISTQPESGRYAAGGTSVAMTVKEAKVLQSFLNDELGAPKTVDI